jgi:hypothetical protein
MLPAFLVEQPATGRVQAAETRKGQCPGRRENLLFESRPGRWKRAGAPAAFGRTSHASSPKEGSQVKGSLFVPTAVRWSLGTALLSLALASSSFAATITGTVKVPADRSAEGTFVVATSDKFDLYRVAVAEDGTFAIENAVAGTYTLSVLGGGMTAADVKNVVVAENAEIKQDFELKAAEPFCIVKAAAPIPLSEDIDSAAFADAPEIQISAGKNLGVGPVEEWAADGGPNLVSGRFRVKYSEVGLHIAADVNFKTPLVNIQTDGNLWNGNALEFDFQNDPYDPTRTGKDAMHNWQVVVGLGETADWWEHNSYNARPSIGGAEKQITTYIARHPKEIKDGVGGEKFRLDVPWAILREGPDGQPISMPEDNALGAMDIVLDAADPNTDRAEAVRKYQVQWSGFGGSHWNASQMVPVKFCPQPPATAGQ